MTTPLQAPAVAVDDTAARVEEIRARAAAATGTAWHWAGNIDTGEPYLATWIPGQGRCQVLDLGEEERSHTGRTADAMRATAKEFGFDPEEAVENWATTRNGDPATDTRLRFNEDGWMIHARERAVFEVAPAATTREDPAVYRADIVDLRHPDAQFIAHSRADISWLLEQNAALRSALDAALASATL